MPLHWHKSLFISLAKHIHNEYIAIGFNEPRIILADEPTAALDSERAAIVMDLLHRVARERQAAIIVVTHDEKVFNRFDRIVRLRDGRLESEATPAASTADD